MPGEPMEMPSETVMVLNVTGFASALAIPSAAASARVLMCMLQGVRLLQVEAMPTWARLKSEASKPTAWSMARAAAFSTPSTTLAE